MTPAARLVGADNPAPEDHGHVVVVDDDAEIRLLVARFLARYGYRVTGARDGVGLDEALARGGVDLVVLDLMLPGRSGLDLCRQVRARSSVPIVILTARGDETDRIVGLEVGADDYLAKPFNPRELLARIRAVLRRSRTPREAAGASEAVAFAGWQLDLRRRELVAPGGAVVELSAGEFDLLQAFVERPGRVLTREQLLEHAKARSGDGLDRVIDVQVSRLRRKLDIGEGPPLIRTVRGAGYLFAPRVGPA